MSRWQTLAAAAMVLVVVVACSSNGPSTADLRHPGNVTELRQKIKSDGPILIKGKDPYWLFIVGPQLVALYPHIEGYDCLLRPMRRNYPMVRDGRRCTNGTYDVTDLSMYRLHVASDGSVTVDSIKTVPVQPEG